MIRQLRRTLASILFLCLSSFAVAQNAQIQGQVTDSSGAVIPKATVRVVNQLTGTERKVETNRSGQYSVPGLDPSTYKIFVQVSGFSTAVSTPITLNVAQNAVLDFKMQVGSEAESVTVDGSGTQLSTTDGSVSTVIDRKFVENIPLNGRSFQSLILLTPGVTTQSPQVSAQFSGYSGEFSVNGQRSESNVYTVDGINANTGGYVYGYATLGSSGALPAATALGTTQSIIPVDALQEFRVQSSSYSAQYGLSPGGQFEFTTRSGTNVIHGSVYDYLRNNVFDANDWFNNHLGKPIQAERQNDFGGTVGGPIWIPRVYKGIDKSFFFFSYEGLRLRQPQAATTEYVPSNSLRAQAPVALQPALKAFPLPTGAEMTNGLAPFVWTDSLPSLLNTVSIRFDHNFGSWLKVFYRFGDTQSSSETRSLASLTSKHQSSYTHGLGLTAILSPKSVNDFRLGYTSNVGASNSILDTFGGAVPANLRQLQGLSGADSYDQVGLYFSGYSPSVSLSQSTQPQHAWYVADSLTYHAGSQTIKVGVEYRKTTSRLQRTTPYVYSLFDTSNAVLANNSYSSGIYIYGRSYPAFTNTAAYVQDEIRLGERLQLSAGVRWEVNPPPGALNGALPYLVTGDFSTPSTLQLAAKNTPFWKTTYYNFAPRLGAAYLANRASGHETVLRAGGGVFFDSGQQMSASAFGNSPGQSASATYSNVSYPLTPAQLNISISDPPAGPYSLGYYFPTHQQLPYTLQWNASIEQAIGKQQSFTISYVGSNGRRLQHLQQRSGANVAPNFSYVNAIVTGTISNYNSLQLKLQRSISKGLQALASYTWSHSIDFGSQNIYYAYSYVRGNSDFDIRNSANVGFSYDIDTPRVRGVWLHLVRDWGLDGRFSAGSAFPISLNGNSIVNADGSIGFSGLNLNPNVPVYISVAGIPGNRQINPAAFSLPSSGQYGNAPRNFVRGFGRNQVDLVVRRSFPLGEGARLQFRAEAFNLPNHPNFGYIVPTYGNAQFGQATKMLNQSLTTLSSLYQQGGPRSMQFALKLSF